jgi:hypothetical protein
MGAPFSSILAENFLQKIVNSHLTHLTQKHRLTNYFQYVNDILLIVDPNHTDIHAILADFNSIHFKLHFTAETEQNSALNYLDVTIHKTPTNIKFSIYRNPLLPTLSFLTRPTTPCNTNTQQSDFYTIG